MRTKWTKEEEDYLSGNTSQTDLDAGKKLGRTEDQVRGKRRRMGLATINRDKVKATVEITLESIRDDMEKLREKKQVSQESKENKILKDELQRKEKELDALLSVGEVKTYTIKDDGSSGNKTSATAVALLSDWHYEEPVKKSQVNGLNEYDTAIAKERIEKLFKVIAQLTKVHQKEYALNNLVLALLGDFISGSIHEDLMESNSIQPTQAIYEVQCLIASGIKYLLRETDVNLIIPCSAGNHCVDEKTEILTNNGFKKAKIIKDGDVIASFDKSNGKMTYDKLVAIEKFSSKGAYHIYGNHKDELVTPEHNLVINNKFVKAKDFTETSIHSFRHDVNYKTSGLKLTDNELRLITWVVMDGTMVDNAKYIKGSNKKRIQFKLSKERKIEELQRLLAEMNIKFTFRPATMSGGNVLQPYYIRIYGDYARNIFDYFGKKKVFPGNFTELSKEQLIVVLETIAITDGREHGGSIEWSSVEKENVNTIQVSCINNGICADYSLNKRPGGFLNSIRKPLYTVAIYPDGFNEDVNRLARSKYVNRTINFVGIQTKNGTIITRCNGIVNFTGNSRITDKQRVSTEYGNSLEILMYRQLKDYFENEKRVEFVIEDSYLTYLNIYKYTVRLHHGHAVKYGGGIGGIFIPAFKAISQWDKQKQADWTFFGHFHQLKDGGNFVTNGSLIGYNAYAVRIKADFEAPKQAFMVIDADRGLEVTRKITL